MEQYKQIISALTLSHLTEEQKLNQPITNKDIQKQLDGLRQVQRLIYSGAVPLCEKFIKIIVCDIFLNGTATHRNVKTLSYKIITILSSFFYIIHILVMDDEPNIG